MHLALRKPIAIKILPAERAQDRVAIERFRREALRAAELRHTNIVGVHDLGYEPALRSYYIVEDFIEGADLKATLEKSGGPLPMEQVLSYIRQIGAALQYAHEQGIIHRDIKPGNILIDSHGRAILCDFGLARMVEGEDVSVTSELRGMPGTPAYMSPEQCKGDALDARTDIYSLALVVYEMLTGVNPFRGPYDTSDTVRYK